MTLEFSNVYDLEKGYKSGGGGSEPVIESLSITPATSSQTITAPTGTDGYSPITVSAVTSAIDSNIQAGNIKNGVSILGVTGTLESGGGANYYIKTDGSIAGYKLDETEAGLQGYLGVEENTISDDYALYRTCYQDTTITTAIFSGIRTISGESVFEEAFDSCSNLTSVDFSNLNSITGKFGLGTAFCVCPNLTTLTFPSLSNITAYRAFIQMLESSPNVSISFPALNSNSFGGSTGVFHRMLLGTSGCTVHFPSNLQSVIGSWSDVTAGFGGTNTTVLFDLPATT